MAWDVRLSNEVCSTLADLTGKTLEIVKRSISELAEDPFGGDVKALKGKKWKGRFRKRAGDYRIIFRVDHKQSTVSVSSVVRRSETTYQ